MEKDLDVVLQVKEEEGLGFRGVFIEAWDQDGSGRVEPD